MKICEGCMHDTGDPLEDCSLYWGREDGSCGNHKGPPDVETIRAELTAALLGCMPETGLPSLLELSDVAAAVLERHDARPPWLERAVAQLNVPRTGPAIKGMPAFIEPSPEDIAGRILRFDVGEASVTVRGTISLEEDPPPATAAEICDNVARLQLQSRLHEMDEPADIEALTVAEEAELVQTLPTVYPAGDLMLPTPAELAEAIDDEDED